MLHQCDGASVIPLARSRSVYPAPKMLTTERDRPPINNTRLRIRPPPIDIHDMALRGEGPVVLRRDSVAISPSCGCKRPWSDRHVSGFRTAGRFGPWPEWTAGGGSEERYLRPFATGAWSRDAGDYSNTYISWLGLYSKDRRMSHSW